MTADLIERLEAAEVGSRELSQLVLCETIAPSGSWVEQSPFNGAWVIYSSRAPDGRARLWEARGDDHQIKIASVSESLDAALALAEWVLPGWAWQFDVEPGAAFAQGAKERWNEGLVAPDAGGVHQQAKALPLAICMAVLKAKSAQTD